MEDQDRSDRSNWVRRQMGQLTGELDNELAPASEPPATPSSIPEASAVGALQSFIGEGADFEGRLRLRGTFRIDSEFKGDIESDTAVIVGESAGLEANIRAREVVISGAVVGDVEASRQLTVRSGGRLHGDADTPCLEIEKGALFNGSMKMARPEESLRAGTRRKLRSGRSSSATAPGATATS